MTLGKAFHGMMASLLVLGLSFAGAVSASAQPSPERAARFVEGLGNQAVALLASKEAKIPEKRQAALRDLIRNGFNLELTCQFVLGKYWNRATTAQREEFQELFTEYLLNSYARRLGSFRAETLTIVASHAVGSKDVLVETSVEGPDGPANPVWRVRADDGQYKIIDVSIDGVSLALTQRREFASVVNRVGLEGLLEMLREKLAVQAKEARWAPSKRGTHVSLLASILASPNANKIGILLARK
ncbi:MAG: phospholipid-binding protein MlaC [Kiloniellaceae bacterium]